jgi:hypothetical protein
MCIISCFSSCSPAPSRHTDICQALTHPSARWHRTATMTIRYLSSSDAPSARWHRTATTTTRGSIHSARPLPISSHPGVKQRTLLLSKRWHRTATCSASSDPGCSKTEYFSFSDRALASYCYPPHCFHSLHPGHQAELTDLHTVLASHASLTASAGTVLPQHDYKQIHSLGTSATNSAACSEGLSMPTSSSIGLCSTQLRAGPLIRHVCYNCLLPASMALAILVDPLRCDRPTFLIPASVAIEDRPQQASVIRNNDISWLFVGTGALPESKTWTAATDHPSHSQLR